jgi:hypothetical protein
MAPELLLKARGVLCPRLNSVDLYAVVTAEMTKETSERGSVRLKSWIYPWVHFGDLVTRDVVAIHDSPRQVAVPLTRLGPVSRQGHRWCWLAPLACDDG